MRRKHSLDLTLYILQYEMIPTIIFLTLVAMYFENHHLFVYREILLGNFVGKFCCLIQPLRG